MPSSAATRVARSRHRRRLFRLQHPLLGRLGFLTRGADRGVPQFRRVARREVAEAVVQAERDERADRDERRELHDRLERERQHHARMVLGRVRVARAEQDREQREHDRDDQPGVRVLLARGRRPLRDRDERDVHGLQLQRDVRDQAERRDDRHEAGDRGVPAVARADDDGERRDALATADRDDLVEEAPA